jgi:hypothetical protein
VASICAVTHHRDLQRVAIRIAGSQAHIYILRYTVHLRVPDRISGRRQIARTHIHIDVSGIAIMEALSIADTVFYSIQAMISIAGIVDYLSCTDYR